MNLRLSTAACALTAAIAQAAAAQQTVASNYRIDYWNTENGLPQSSVNAITQTRDGYLWLATLGGVARFDGQTFTSMTTGDTPGLRSDRVLSVVDDALGRVWIGTENGLSRLDHGRVTTFGVADGMPGDRVKALAAAPDGSIWFGTGNGAIGRIDAAGIHSLVPALGKLGNTIEDILIDDTGTVWVTGRTGVWTFRAGQPALPPTAIFGIAPNARHEPHVSRAALDREPGHGVWIASDSGIIHLDAVGARRLVLDRRARLDPRAVVRIGVAAPNVLWLATRDSLWRVRADSGTAEAIDGLHVQAIFGLLVDREGNVWLGDRIAGLARVRPRLFRAITQADGLPQDNVVSGFPDSRDRVWIAARCSGVGLLEGNAVHALFGKGSGECVDTFGEDASGDIWMGGAHLTRWHDGTVVARYDSTNGLPRGSVRAIARARDGTLWIATFGGLATWDGTHFTPRPMPDAIGLRSTRVLSPARDGSLWIGTEGGLLHYTGGIFHRLTIADGLPNDHVRALREDSTGLWIATYGGGLARLRNGRLQTFSTRDGLFDNYLSSISDDGHGNFWFSSNRGVFRITRRELEQYTPRPGARLHSVAYGRADGMPSAEANGGFQSGVARTSDGRLWYPTVAGVAVVDPGRAQSSVPPPVTVERLVVDGRAVDSTDHVRLGPDLASLEISYAGLSLSSPNAVTFRYRLEPWDRDWIDAGTRRTAIYSRLPHGVYRFRVMAANREGTWGAESSTLTFTVLPHYWQTWWFRVLAGLGALALALAAYRARLAQLRAAARRREAAILESITDGFLALDHDGRFTYVNHTAQRVLGREARELLGRTLFDAVPSMRGTITERELRHVESERTATVFEAPDTPVTGTWLEIHAYPTDDGISVYFADVTDRKRAEEELRCQKEEIEAQAEELAQQTDELARQNEILEENVRLKDEVERISRHDLRTPLNTIISLAQIVREDRSLTVEHETSLRLIEQAGYRVLNMASLTLDLFKMEQGTYTLDARPVDLRAVVDRALGDLQPLLRTRQITADISTSGDAPPFVLGDELLTQAMATNLLKNAIEASPSGGTVTIRIEAGVRIAMYVHNAGAIPAEVRGRFFEKYATSGKKGGTGLGAYSARLMARTQGGDITVESSSASGTMVTIDLPRANALPNVIAPAVSTEDAAADTLPPRRILVVDDDASNRAILRRFLSAPAWIVDESENGPLAVKLAADREYDVIFMDIEMPVMDGFETTERIRAAEQAHRGARPARIIAFSSHDDEPTRQRAAIAGCDRYLTKPATRQALVQVVLGNSGVPAAVANLDPAIRDLVPAFLDRKRGEVHDLVTAIAAGDAESARRISHRMRGSFSVYGFAEASEICARIEEAARAGRLGETADKQARSLYDHLRATRDAAAPGSLS